MADQHLPTIAGTDPTRNALDNFRIAIAQHVHTSLHPHFPNLTLESVYDAVDYSKKGADFTVALPRFKLPGPKKPADYSDEFKKQFDAGAGPNGDKWVESVTANGPFLLFQCRTEQLVGDVLKLVDKKTRGTESGVPEYGSNEVGKGKRIIIEYSSPNIAKKFHVGHLRSTIIGAFLNNLYKACGWETITMNYLGDWGKQFGLIAVGFDKYGDEAAMEKDPIKHLYDVYVKINADAEKDETVHDAAREYFKRMEDGDESALVQWRKWREHSIEKYKSEYKLLNVEFDHYVGESMVGRDIQLDTIKKLEEMGLVQDSDRAKLIDLEEKYKLGKAVLLKKDGTTIYLTRDLGGAIERWEKYKFDKMLYVVASQQDLHFAQCFKILSLMGFEWANRLEHINYGLVTGMSTRKGTAVFLDEIIDESAQIMLEQMKKNEEKFKQIEDPAFVARETGITAIKVQDMQAKRINNYTFDWKRMTAFEGDTGPYLQYAHVRLSSMERKNPDLLPLPPISEIDFSLLTEPKARDIAFHLGTYPDAILTALKSREPSGIVTYCMKLSHFISSAWDVLQVKGEPNVEKAKARMWLFLSARDVLGAGMRLLSLTPLERM